MSLRLSEQLCFALYAASRAVTSTYVPLLEPMGLTYSQYIVMLVLWENDGLSVKRIGEALMLDSGTLTPLLKRLEGQGLVTRRRSTQDERVVEIFLTAQGKRLKQKAKSVPEKLVCNVGVPVEHLIKLREELQALTRAIHAAQGEAPEQR